MYDGPRKIPLGLDSARPAAQRSARRADSQAAVGRRVSARLVGPVLPRPRIRPTATRMTPAARIAAAIEILADIETRRRPASDALKDWGLTHRFAGSGDR